MPHLAVSTVQFLTLVAAGAGQSDLLFTVERTIGNQAFRAMDRSAADECMEAAMCLLTTGGLTLTGVMPLMPLTIQNMATNKLIVDRQINWLRRLKRHQVDVHCLQPLPAYLREVSAPLVDYFLSLS